MKNTKKNYEKLLNEYESLKNELMNHEENLYDSMNWDLEGYYEEYNNKDLFDNLYNQVLACKSLLKGYKKLNYIFS